MNRLSHQLALDHNTTFNQRCRILFLKVFGHESLVSTKDLRAAAYCTVLKVDIQKIARINPDQLAKRKLFNPFKYIEFALTALFELPLWLLIRSTYYSADKYNDENCYKTEWKATAVTLYGISIQNVVYPVLLLLYELVFFFVRRALAPARYLIRPWIEMARTQPRTFLIVLACSLLFSLALCTCLWFGLIPIGITLASAAAIIATKIALSAAITLATTAILTRGVTLSQEIKEMHTRMHQTEFKSQPKPEIKKLSSVHFITEALHARNRKLSKIKPASEQDLKETLALFLGVEALSHHRHFKRKPHHRKRKQTCGEHTRACEHKQTRIKRRAAR